MPPPKEQIDLTRLNRKERRQYKGVKIPGRNKPFVKGYMSLHDWSALQEKEIEAEKQQHGNNQAKEIS